VQALALQAAARGCRIFEQSAVLQIDAERRIVATAQGVARAPHIVLATHTPKGMHGVQAEMLVDREYGLAGTLLADTPEWPPGIFWGRGNERHSARSVTTEQGDFLVVIGDEHRTGQHAAADSAARLDEFARRAFGVQEVHYRWSAQNYRAADGLPYIGRDSTGLFIATGFADDGLTYGTLAATMLADEIEGRDNPWRELYRADRVTPLKSARGVLDQTLGVAKAFVEDRLGSPPAATLDELLRGHAALVEMEGEPVAAYRDDHGALFMLSAVCTHMKCHVRWNDAERSWDCPCHGSRYAPDGSIIEGPALEPLRRLGA
jgi:Rieske Fe-S protein